MVFSVFGITFHQIPVYPGAVSVAAFLIAAALRSAMKTERGRLAVAIAENLSTQTEEDIKIPETPKVDIEKAVEAFKKALTETS